MRVKLTHCLAVLIACGLAGCNDPPQRSFQGWVEADFVFVAPDEAGRLETLGVREGESVIAGQPLFSVDEDLVSAELRQSQAALTNAEIAFERAERLLKSNSGTQAAFDNSQAALREATARVDTVKTRLARRKIVSPVYGAVQKIYFRPGEVVPAGRPVVSLLAPANIKIRFFVPEPLLPKVTTGDRIAVECDGCTEPIGASVKFISGSAEYTPPVIYSLDERAKLVFMVEAMPDQPAALRVGQPLSVKLVKQEAAR